MKPGVVCRKARARPSRKLGPPCLVLRGFRPGAFCVCGGAGVLKGPGEIFDLPKGPGKLLAKVPLRGVGL